MPNGNELSRRGFIAGTLGSALALAASADEELPLHPPTAPKTPQASASAPAPQAAAPTGSPAKGPVLGKADIDQMMKDLSNWGRWGHDDQIGTVNLITPARRKEAAKLVREGISVSMAHEQSTEKMPDNPAPLIHLMTATGATGRGPVTFAFDTYTMNYHGFFFSHMDALSHCFWDHHLYNNNPPETVTTDGAQSLDIAAFKNGILTRGVLMDIPRLKGVPYLEPETLIYPEDLDAWEKEAKLKVQPGDFLFLRTGRWAYRAAKGSWNIGRASAGLYATCVKWLHERDISVLASDTGSDVVPSRIEGVGNPIHALVLVALGTPIFDNLDLEAVSETCARLKRWDFMATAAPMVIPKGTGSPLNPIATF